MTKKFITPFALAALCTLVISGCKKDDNPEPESPVYSSVFYFVNEGNFGSGDGTISYYDGSDTSNIVIEDDLFFKVNNRPLGDVVQSLAFHNGKGYIAVNNSHKLEVVEANSFASVATVSVGSPRSFTGVSASKGYVTDWETNSVKVLDLSSNTVTGSITAGQGPEKMLLSGQKLYVSNSGGWSADSVLTVIDTGSDAAVATITVAPMPNAMQKDKNGKLWVICGGLYDGSRPGALVRVNMAQDQKELQLNIPNNTDHPQALAISPAGDYVYYNLFDKVYRMDVNATALPATPFIEISGANIYALEVNQATGDLLVVEAPFTTNGTLHVFTAAGQAKLTIPTGKFTNQVVVR